MNTNIITLTGDLGSGKSTTSHLLIDYLKDYKLVSTGSIFRKIAKERKITVNDLSILAEKDQNIDKLIDDELIKLSLLDQKLIVDSKMAWYFMPNSIKVYLCVEEDIAVHRILKSDRGETEKYNNFYDASEKLRERRKSEHQRFFNKYNVDIFDLKNYDLIINTSYISEIDTMQQIIKFAGFNDK